MEINAFKNAKAKLLTDLNLAKEENEKTRQAYSANKTQLTKAKNDLENQAMLVKVLEQAKLKLKAENDSLKSKMFGVNKKVMNS